MHSHKYQGSWFLVPFKNLCNDKHIFKIGAVAYELVRSCYWPLGGGQWPQANNAAGGVSLYEQEKGWAGDVGYGSDSEILESSSSLWLSAL